MKRFDSSPHAAGADSSASYFRHGLLAKSIQSDQSLARPTEQVVRRRWVNRMILSEIGFVLGVALLQLFPVIEDSSAAAIPQPRVTIPAVTATAVPSPKPTQISDVIAATTIAALPQPTLEPLHDSIVVPVALPDTGRDDASSVGLYAVPLLCIGSALVLWSLAAPRSTHDTAVVAAEAPARDAEGIVV